MSVDNLFSRFLRCAKSMAESALCYGDIISLSSMGPSSGGTMAVNGMSVVTLGPDTPSAHEYYGTAAVIDDLKALPTWPACEWRC